GGRIWIGVEKQADEIVVAVRDSGAGIPREMLSKVFDLFTQIDHSLDRSHGGLGVGLTLVRRLVELHGGSVQAFSEGPGQGSEFVVRLPLLAADISEAAGAGSAEPQSSMTARRILAVDDNKDSV